eukprot:COSAG02_NODE_37377_length_442_cov_1.769679_1_plen_56_part_00
MDGALTELMAKLDERKADMPEVVYLDLCNCVKRVYEQRPQPAAPVSAHTFCTQSK